MIGVGLALGTLAGAEVRAEEVPVKGWRGSGLFGESCIRYLAYVYNRWDYCWSESDRTAFVTLKVSVLAGKTLQRGKGGVSLFHQLRLILSHLASESFSHWEMCVVGLAQRSPTV